MVYNSNSFSVNNPSSECAQRKKDSCKCCPHVCQCCCTTGADNWRTYEILKKICRKIFQEFEKEQSKEKYTLFGGGNSINLRIHRSSEKQPPDRKGEDPCEIEMRNKYNEPDLHKNVVLKSNIVRETQENRDEKFSKKKLTKDNLKKIDVKEKSEKRKGKDGKEEGKDEKGKNEKRKIEERKTEKKRKDEKEKGDRRKSDKWRGEREKNDKEKGEKEKGNKERSEKKKSEKEEGDKEKSEKKKGEKEKGDKEKSEKKKGEKEKGDKEKSEKKKGENEKGDKGKSENKKSEKRKIEKENPRKEVKPISKKRNSSIQNRKSISKNEKDEPKKSTRMSMLLSKQRKPKKDIENDNGKRKSNTYSEHVSEGNKKNVKKVLDSIPVINDLRGKVRRGEVITMTQKKIRKEFDDNHVPQKSNDKYKGEKKINVISTKHKEKPKDKSLVKKKHIEITENRKAKRDVSNLHRMDQVQACDILRADMEERDLQRHKIGCSPECNCFMPCVIPAPCNCNCIHTC